MTPRFVIIRSGNMNGVEVHFNPLEARTLHRAETTWDALMQNYREDPDGTYTMKLYDRQTDRYVRVARMVSTVPVRPYTASTAPTLDQYRLTPEARAAAIADLPRRRCS